jgi:hypothetical protein
MAAKVARGLVLNTISKMAVNISEMIKEARGTSKIALRDSVFRFSKTKRIRYSRLGKKYPKFVACHMVSQK